MKRIVKSDSELFDHLYHNRKVVKPVLYAKISNSKEYRQWLKARNQERWTATQRWLINVCGISDITLRRAVAHA